MRRRRFESGRFTLRTPMRVLVEQFQLGDAPDLEPRYNIAPTQNVAAVRVSPASEKRELAMLHWGLIPFWAKDPKVGYSTINARAETVATKPAFREAFRKRRCLILADGFYEWQKTTGDKKQPHLIHMKDDSPSPATSSARSTLTRLGLRQPGLARRGHESLRCYVR
jgi:putative SOS response-associated peptidase YedK